MLAIVPQPRPSSSYSVVVSVAIWHRKFFREVNLIGEDQSKDLRRVTNRTWECEREGERERESHKCACVRFEGEREGGREERGRELCVCRHFVTSLEERLELGTIGRERERRRRWRRWRRRRRSRRVARLRFTSSNVDFSFSSFQPSVRTRFLNRALALKKKS